MRAGHFLLPFLALMGLTGCSDDGPTSTPPNTPPTAVFTVNCVALTCTMTEASVDPDGTIQAHAYDFGDGESSTEANPVHTYADPGGKFTVRLTVTDDGGMTGTTTRDVTVSPAPPSNQAPAADFVATCFYLTCVFTDQSTDPDQGDAIAIHAWDFGDGQSMVSDQVPIHEYADPGGQFTVTLTVTDTHGASSSVAKQLSVSPPPPSSRVGTYERETSHSSPMDRSRFILHADGRFEMHHLTATDSTSYWGNWYRIPTWGGWPIDADLAVELNFDDFPVEQFCRGGYGTFFEIAGATHMALALCRAPMQAGLEEGFYVSPAATGNPGSRPPQAGQLAFVRNGQIHLVNTDGSGAVSISAGPNDFDPAWSPDGSRLAFARAGAGPGIYLMNADGTNLVQRTTIGSAPAWSPDGQSLVFECADAGGQGALCTVEVDDPAAPVVLIQSTAGGQVYTPTWSPDGSLIAHTSDRMLYDFWFDIWVVAPDGSGLTALINHTPAMANPFEFYQPAWSPDGQRIALVTCSWAWQPCSSSVVSVMQADGSGLAWLAVAGGPANPTWSPDGQVVAFSSANAIEWVSADGVQWGRIVVDGHSPAWRP